MTTTNLLNSQADPFQGLMRHFADLRDGTYGNNAFTRGEKESFFASAVTLLDDHARQVLEEMNARLLLNSGKVVATGVTRSEAGIEAKWYLTWPQQEQRRLSPVILNATFGYGFHHPHLQGATVGVWPLNVFNENDAAIELPILRAIASADLHNLVFESDYSIIPATMVKYS